MTESLTNICTKCNIKKDINEFQLRKSRKKGITSWCKQCISNYKSQKNFKAKMTGKKICVDCKLKKSILCFFAIRRNKDGRDIRCKYCENKRKLKILKNNPHIRITENLRKRTRDVLKGISKSKPTLGLIGCSKEDLVIHLELMFTEGMSWENYGDWQIDHVRPCSSFDLSDPLEQEKCFHYSNLQPLWATDNKKKGNKYE